MLLRLFLFFFFFFNDTATTEIYTLSLHDALPISTARSTCGRCTAPPGGRGSDPRCAGASWSGRTCCRRATTTPIDRKSTRLNSSHGYISYAVFCLKKKKKTTHNVTTLRHDLNPSA